MTTLRLTKAMISPNDVELLIFDLDGTIVKSDKANFEAIKRALSQMNLDVHVSEEDVKKVMGVSSEEAFRIILPPDKYHLWREIRTKATEQNISSLRDFAHVFPGVIETLEILRRRGYRLALYSNSSVQYFNSALSALNIKDHFDYLECVQEHNLTKTELVRKIKNKFSNLKAAVIGDRIHDIETASENNALPIGVLYGYGEKEPKQADITINKFSELLDVFDRKLLIFEKILEEINRRKQKDQAFVLGINGIDGAGKTKFAEAFEEFLISKNYETQIIPIDDFHNPQVFRYAGENQAENYYNRSFDTKRIVEELLVPLRQNSIFSTRLTVLDWHTDKYDIEREFSFNQNTIVIFEGVFLFRKELSLYIDYKIFIEVPFEESKRRAWIRDAHVTQEELKKYDEKYLPAQRKYLDKFPPSKVADMIIDNSDWEYPRVTFLRS